MANKYQSVRGFNDVLPAESLYWRKFMEAVQAVMDAYGYQEIGLPILESTELFKRSVGEATDIVEKEMFSFLDREKNSVSLRPEGTASCVRAGINAGLLHNQIQRFWYRGPMFRHERPQAGRYRQFHQVGVEAYGMSGATIDVEVIALSARLWKLLGIKNLTLELNSLGSTDERGLYREALVEYLKVHESSLDEDSRRRLKTNPLRILDSKLPATREILSEAPKFANYLQRDSRKNFEAVQAGLKEIDISFVLNSNLVRGLDYYTRTVFEWTTAELGAQATVCAGGRYDGLVEQLGGGQVPAFGFALGVERLVLLMQQQRITGADIAPQAYLCWVASEDNLQKQRAVALKLAEQLRDNGFRIQMDAAGARADDLAKQFKRADRSGARYALVLKEPKPEHDVVPDDDEAAHGAVQVKSLRDNSLQTEITWAELPARLHGLLHLK